MVIKTAPAGPGGRTSTNLLMQSAKPQPQAAVRAKTAPAQTAAPAVDARNSIKDTIVGGLLTHTAHAADSAEPSSNASSAVPLAPRTVSKNSVAARAVVPPQLELAPELPIRVAGAAGVLAGAAVGQSPDEVFEAVLNHGTHTWRLLDPTRYTTTEKSRKYIRDVAFQNFLGVQTAFRVSTVRGESEDTYFVGPTFIWGAYGAVRFGLKESSGEPVALKAVYMLAPDERDELVDDMQREERMQRSPAKPPMAPTDVSVLVNERDHLQAAGLLLDQIIDTSKYYFVMPYASTDGIDLLQGVASQADLSAAVHEAWITHFVMKIGESLQGLHARGLAALDVKPENVLIFSDGSVRVTDFATAQAEDEQTEGSGRAAISGTLGYLAPEVYFSGWQPEGASWGKLSPIDTKADVWSMAIIALDHLTGGTASAFFGKENDPGVWFAAASQGDGTPTARRQVDVVANYGAFRAFHAGLVDANNRLREQAYHTLCEDHQNGQHAPGTPEAVFAPLAVSSPLLFEAFVVHMLAPDSAQRASSRDVVQMLQSTLRHYPAADLQMVGDISRELIAQEDAKKDDYFSGLRAYAKAAQQAALHTAGGLHVADDDVALPLEPTPSVSSGSTLAQAPSIGSDSTLASVPDASVSPGPTSARLDAATPGAAVGAGRLPSAT
jgi:serine/threonine protein kinase